METLMLNLHFTLEKVIFLTAIIESFNIPTNVPYTVSHIYINVKKLTLNYCVLSIGIVKFNYVVVPDLGNAIHDGQTFSFLENSFFFSKKPSFLKIVLL